MLSSGLKVRILSMLFLAGGVAPLPVHHFLSAQNSPLKTQSQIALPQIPQPQPQLPQPQISQAQAAQSPTTQSQATQAQVAQAQTSQSANATPSQATPAFQQPPSPPQVSYADGQLQVNANNSTVADVVSAIQNATGATMEGATVSSTDRIFGQFGPATPSTVLSAVLLGSPYDFIIVGSQDEGNPIHQIIVSEKSSASAIAQRTQPVVPANGGVNGRASGVSDASSYTDPQWTVPQYRYVPPTNQPGQVPGQPQPGQPMPGQPGFQPAGNTQPGQVVQPGDLKMQGRMPQHWGANGYQNAYGQSNVPQTEQQQDQQPQ